MADTIKQEFFDQVLHASAAFCVVFFLRLGMPTWLAFFITVLIGLAREFIQHRSIRIGFGSALDVFVLMLGAGIGALI